MTYLAYDPDRLRMLQVRAQLAVEQLFRLRNDDPDASDAMGVVRRTTADVHDGMLPAVWRVLHAQPLRAAIDDRDDLPAVQNALARFMAIEHGWAVALDPLADDPARVTVEEATALGRRLQELSPNEVVGDSERLTWVTNELEVIGRDPQLSAAFAAEFHAWADWAIALARPRALRVAHIEGTTHAGLGQIEAAIAGFAHVAHHAVRGDAMDLQWLDTIDPYAAALFVRELGLTGRQLAATVDRILVSPRMELDDLPGENTADLLLKTMLAEPTALVPFLTSVMQHPTALFDHLVDPTLADQVVLRASDPALVGPDEARGVVIPVLEYFAHDESLDPGTLLADLVAPWTVYFSPSNLEWGLDTDHSSHLMEVALHSDGALARFVERSDDIVAGARRVFATDDARSIADFTSYLGMIGELLVNERIRRIDLRDRGWRAVFSIASLAASFVPGAVVGSVVAIGIIAVQHVTAPDHSDELRRARLGADVAVTEAAVVIARTVYDGWLTNGRIDERVPPPPEIDLDGRNIP